MFNRNLKKFCIIACICCCFPAFSQKIPQNNVLIGKDTGLYLLSESKENFLQPLWTEASIIKIVETPEAYFLLTSKGIFKTLDFTTFEEKNAGLPFSTIKEYHNKTKTFSKQIHGLKDLKVHPQNAQILVTGTRDEVFISYDGAETWQSLGFSARSMGLKSVAVANLPTDDELSTELVVFMSHPLFGLSYKRPQSTNKRWIDITAGFDIIPTMKTPDEIADIIPIVTQDETGKEVTEIYLSQTFIPRLYKLDWKNKRGEILWKGALDNAYTDSLFFIENAGGKALFFTSQDGFAKYDFETKEVITNPARSHQWNEILNTITEPIHCAFLPQTVTGLSQGLFLGELWTRYPQNIASKYTQKILDKKSLYVPIYQAYLPNKLEEHLATVKRNNLNSVVLDMKDDYGLLRFDAKNPEVLKKGYKSAYALELDAFVKKLKEQNLYLIARIVVFKDKHLSTYNNKEYAVWDKANNIPWRGIRGTIKEKNELGEVINQKTDYYDEYWVDPYSEEVWEYNVQIAQELIERGFDEIQFDYIRFPTDGKNLGDTQYRWKASGMDMESALISFLKYARENIDAPIGIDIYGANGWYRSGVRTGQDVELLAPYVDVICPMLYPSHFEQPFLAYPEAQERPYRIYYFGTFRNAMIGRGQILVRPWVQAFYYNVSYDRTYYNPDYVAREVYGTRDAQPLANGYMYWNNAGRYDDLRPDPENTPYPWGENSSQEQN